MTSGTGTTRLESAATSNDSDRRSEPAPSATADLASDTTLKSDPPTPEDPDRATALDSLETLAQALPVTGRTRIDQNEGDLGMKSNIGKGVPPPRDSGAERPLTTALGLVIDCDVNQPDSGYADGGSHLGWRDDHDPILFKRRLGTTKFFNGSKGFGFILDHDAEELGNAEVFVHYTAIDAVQGGSRAFKSLLEASSSYQYSFGDPLTDLDVSYHVIQGPKGWQAQAVTGPNGGPCIGGAPPVAIAPRSSYPNGQSGQRRTSAAGFDGGSKERRASGMIGSPGQRRGRGDSGYYSSSTTTITSPRDTYSNMSSPPSQGSSQLPGTPHSPFFHPLSPNALPPLMFSPGGSMHHPLAYGPPFPPAPPPPLPPHEQPVYAYYPVSNGYGTPLNGYAPAPLPMPLQPYYPTVLQSPSSQQQQHHHLESGYPISSATCSSQPPSSFEHSIPPDITPRDYANSSSNENGYCSPSSTEFGGLPLQQPAYPISSVAP
ncbi:cold shock domain-containing protein [Sporobolomyces koalae]|uniref:cold shock domain-containing protein n=1 Tax=Sporobolomyces koalae TaxID=500713 RepID=UPI00316EA836